MTELSFNVQSTQVSNETKTSSSSEDSGFSEKHVRIDDDDLPVVYKPKSFSIPDLLEPTNYEMIIHQHPVLKFSTTTDIDVKTLLPREAPVSCSPFAQRKNKNMLSVPSTSGKWKKNEVSRKRGKTFPPCLDENNTQNDRMDVTRQRLNNNNNGITPKWLHFLKKINFFPKFNKNKTRSRKEGSFHDLPPIRLSVSMDHLNEQENNNNEVNNTDDNDYVFTQTKCYRPASECLKQTKMLNERNEPVTLKRIKSLPIL